MWAVYIKYKDGSVSPTYFDSEEEGHDFIELSKLFNFKHVEIIDHVTKIRTITAAQTILALESAQDI